MVFIVDIWWMWHWKNNIVFKVENKTLDSKLEWIKIHVLEFTNLVYAKGLPMEEQ